MGIIELDVYGTHVAFVWVPQLQFAIARRYSKLRKVVRSCHSIIYFNLTAVP